MHPSIINVISFAFDFIFYPTFVNVSFSFDSTFYPTSISVFITSDFVLSLIFINVCSTFDSIFYPTFVCVDISKDESFIKDLVYMFSSFVLQIAEKKSNLYLPTR